MNNHVFIAVRISKGFGLPTALKTLCARIFELEPYHMGVPHAACERYLLYTEAPEATRGFIRDFNAAWPGITFIEETRQHETQLAAQGIKWPPVQGWAGGIKRTVWPTWEAEQSGIDAPRQPITTEHVAPKLSYSERAAAWQDTVNGLWDEVFTVSREVRGCPGHYELTNALNHLRRAWEQLNDAADEFKANGA